MASTAPVHYLPIATTVVAAAFTVVLVRRHRARGGLHHLWWAAGAAAYGLGTAAEAWVTLLGWNPVVFRTWYVAGALLGGAPLAQGTAYLLLEKRVAHRLSVVLVLYLAFAATSVWVAPLDLSLVETHRLTGKVIAWTWVRMLSPWVNVYALVLLVGGAVLSAVRFRARGERGRATANVLIAIGGLLPGIGGAATRAGYTEVLYVLELAGLLLIIAGYRASVRAPPPAPPPPPGRAVAVPTPGGIVLRRVVDVVSRR